MQVDSNLTPSDDHTDELLRTSGKLRGRLTALALQLGRDLGPISPNMKPQDAWLNQLVAAQENLPRGKFFDRFRRKDKLEQYCLAVTYLHNLSNDKKA